MKTAAACLLACSSTLLALDVQPSPGLDLSPASFTDVRLMLGVAAPVTATDAGLGGGSIRTTEATGPQGGLQWVHGRVDSIGWAIGIELAAAEHRGKMHAAAPLNGDAVARVATLNVLPKLVLRPERMDPIDWIPGCFQLEIGPVLGCGAGQVSLSDSTYSNPTAVLKWGARMEGVFTSQTGLQIALFVGYEDFLSSPKWDAAEGSLKVSGITGGVSVGWRLR